MAATAFRARLRGKTGCITCRRSRIKCDEEKPRCGRCKRSNFACEWPRPEQLVDRRNLKGPRVSFTRRVKSLQEFEDDAVLNAQHGGSPSSLSISSRAQFPITDVETLSVEFFFKVASSKFFLTSARDRFKNGVLSDLVQMAIVEPGLKDALVALGSVILHPITGDASFEHLSLSRYYHAIGRVVRVLDLASRNGEGFDNATQMTVYLLFIHGLMSVRTRHHIPQHLRGAVKVVSHRCIASKPPSVDEPFQRLMYEGILYNVFRETIHHPFRDGFEPDFDFVDQAMSQLGELSLEGATFASNSPVLGMSMDLHILIHRIVQHCRTSTDIRSCAQRDLQQLMHAWEDKVLGPSVANNIYRKSTMDDTAPRKLNDIPTLAQLMYVLAASILLECSTSQCHKAHSTMPQLWQFRQAIQLLKDPSIHEIWTDCYLGSWPSLIFGYVAQTVEEVAVIRQDLVARYGKLFFVQDLFCLQELESMWQEKGISPGVPVWIKRMLPTGKTTDNLKLTEV